MASVASRNLSGFQFRNTHLLRGQRDTGEFPVIVDYNLSIERMVNMGEYSHVTAEIYSKFSASGTGLELVNLRLIRFRNVITIAEVEDCISKMGFAPAKIEHLLVFGYMYPEQQLEHSIIALGSKWDHAGGSVNAPVLNGFNRLRSVGLYLANEFVEHHGCRRFLVIE
jgi:hypothetical protein